MVQVKVAVVQVLVPSWTEVAVYEVIGEPPVFRGADQDRATWVFPRTPLRELGAAGAAITTVLRMEVDGPYPHLLADLRLNWYFLPVARDPNVLVLIELEVVA